EVFPVSYTLNVARRYFHSLGSNVDWPATPAIADDWTKPDPGETVIGGERRVVSIQTTRATVKQPGIFTLKPASQMVNLMVGSSGFGLFTQPNVEQRQLDSNPLELTVKALPAPPPEFTGAVGQFTFTSKIVPLTGAVGEPITWTLELGGSGNWPDIAGLPQREVSNDFQVVQPKSKRTMKDGTLFEGTLTEDVVLVPTKPGTYRLAPVRFSYFDPATGVYKSIASEPVTLTISAASAPVLPPASSGAPVQFSLTPTTPTTPGPTLPPAVAPVPPENLPRDVIEQPARGLAPSSLRKLVLACVLGAVLCPVLLWLALATQRSRSRDLQRRRREAHADLVRILAELRSNGLSPSVVTGLLQRWQERAAQLWEIPHAAPGSPLVLACVSRYLPDAAPAWARLWSEADRAQHGREASLPADWLMRADGALQAVRVPGWNPLSLFSGRNLFPFLFSLVIVVSLFAPVPAHAQSAASQAYHRGDFATAEQNWLATLKAAPDDWTARHNLGLALGQQDRWGEATAYWTGAFLRNSRSETTRWDLNLGVQRSGLANPQLIELARGEGGYKLARLATPGEWQLGLVAAALLLALAGVVLLLQGYRWIGRWGMPTALVACLLGMLLAAAATYSLRLYGPLAHPDAVFVSKATVLRSIPTEADTSQKTSPLSAGSIAIVEKPFFGWSKLNFSGGQSGWVRSEELIPLYR
ncbi:MAG TPA: BatD family protein, partial [Lacunisphaera sp.]|nr:BatD family protein [Lacunisphaera sp.]